MCGKQLVVCAITGRIGRVTNHSVTNSYTLFLVD